jgi:hypothetical protein
MAKFKCFEPRIWLRHCLYCKTTGMRFTPPGSPIKDLPLLPHEGLAYWQAADYDSKREF